MNRKKDKRMMLKTASRRFAASVLMLLIVILQAAGTVHAETVSAGVTPVREAHRVKVADRRYCVFVQKNVVMTDEEIGKMSDKELVLEILKRSGFYMKETNCRKSGSRSFSIEDWIKRDGSFLLEERDLEDLRRAEPEAGRSVKLHMDLLISPDPFAEEEKAEDPDSGQEDSGSTETGTEKETDSDTEKETGSGTEKDSEAGTGTESSGSDAVQGEKSEEAAGDKTDGKAGESTDSEDSKTDGDTDSKTDGNIKLRTYSTYKLLSPELLFISVVSKSDASATEDICKENTKTPDAGTGSKVSLPEAASEKKDMLPEFRTINMTDRSGPPLEDTLKDGSPVTLSWKEPAAAPGDTEETNPARRIAAAAVIAVLIGAAAVAIVRKKRKTL